MSAPAIAWLAYLWHYMLARLLYDQLLRPMLHGRVPTALIVAAGAGALFRLGRRSRRSA
jgi:hypothetical protein